MALSHGEYSYFISPNAQYLDRNGIPLSAGFLELRIAGTDEEYISYSDWDGTPNPFRIPLDSQGRCVCIVKMDLFYDMYVYNYIGNLEYSRLRVNAAGGDYSIEGLVRNVRTDSQYMSVSESFNGDGTKNSTISIDLSGFQEKLEAGENITINGNVISATDTTYTAGNGIVIENNVIKLDPNADMEIDYWMGSSSMVATTDLVANMTAQKTRGDSIYADSNGNVKLKKGTYGIHAVVEITNTSTDTNIYPYTIDAHPSSPSTFQIAGEWNNSFLHTDRVEISYIVVNPTDDVNLSMYTNLFNDLSLFHTRLSSLQVYCLNGLGSNTGEQLPPASPADEGKVLSVDENGNPEWRDVNIPEIPVTDVEVDGVSVVNAQGVAEITMPTDLVPEVTSSDNGKVLQATYEGGQGSFSWEDAPISLPDSTSADAGKVLTVDNNGDAGWADPEHFTQVQADWAETDSSDPSYIQNKPTIPTKTSDLTNDSGFIDASDVPAAQVQADWLESDSTDPAYIQNKPTINNVPNVTSSDDGKVLQASYTGGVGGYSWEDAPNGLPDATSADEGKILSVDSNGDPEWVAPQVYTQEQADWAESDSTKVDYIKNKPTIPTKTSDLTNDSGFIDASDVPAAQEQSDWSESDSSDPTYIKNKPTIPTATSDLTNDSGFITASDVPASQEQSDWAESSSADPAYIKNKPVNLPIAAGTNVTITESNNTLIISASGGGAGTVTDVTVDGSSVVNAQGVAEITMPTVPTKTSDLTNDSGFITASDVPAAQAQADWNESDSNDPSYIQNKPSIPVIGTISL